MFDVTNLLVVYLNVYLNDLNLDGLIFFSFRLCTSLSKILFNQKMKRDFFLFHFEFS